MGIDVIAAVDASKMPGQFNRSWAYELAEVARKRKIASRTMKKFLIVATCRGMFECLLIVRSSPAFSVNGRLAIAALIRSMSSGFAPVIQAA